MFQSYDGCTNTRTTAFLFNNSFPTPSTLWFNLLAMRVENVFISFSALVNTTSVISSLSVSFNSTCNVGFAVVQLSLMSFSLINYSFLFHIRCKEARAKWLQNRLFIARVVNKNGRTLEKEWRSVPIPQTAEYNIERNSLNWFSTQRYFLHFLITLSRGIALGIDVNGYFSLSQSLRLMDWSFRLLDCRFRWNVSVRLCACVLIGGLFPTINTFNFSCT